MLRLYNTLSRRKEAFKPILRGNVTMYNCGLTVYDYATIGNLRAFTFVDVLRRYLEYKGFKVKQVMNFTDVGHMFHDVDIGEDKMEAAVHREKKDPWMIAELYIEAFLEDAEKMNFLEPYLRPRATDHINEMIGMIQTLIEKDYAYVMNGSVYFDVSKFKEYGRLSGNTMERLKQGAGGRVDHNPEKKSQFDFALWISDPSHIMNWPSPWAKKGYPGWHIECSAMAAKYLGETIDIHTGGVDNLFPHHENEIAQSETCTGKKFANYWLHNEHLLVNGKRMGKSLGNFYTLQDLTAKGYTAEAVRYALLATHYRQQLNFTLEGLDSAKSAVERLENLLDRLLDAKGTGTRQKARTLLEETLVGFEEAMDDDLNINLALARIFDFVRQANKMIDDNVVSKSEAEEMRELMMKLDTVLGVLHRPGRTAEKTVTVMLDEVLKGHKPGPSEEIIHMVKSREEARKTKDWERADKIRERLREMGVVVEDTSRGPRLRFALEA